ncbi:PAQR family membrane homeostasis protein TrhA [Pedobacter sandarakinus]|uniref:PAQR family membrane homeostasis protein TrhA n=1 Tax=Pedobacter sandarakinus TaxID=353156 RepID=UPI002246FF7C|nr:hemolysin III family protein [Pedobacter sandarakinus]MCX2576306.1 hemolysin III family protein [Pedobacter sandarakinus]
MRKLREPVNFFTHFIPALVAIPAGYFLLVKCHTPIAFTAAWIYSIGMFVLFSVSAMYHGYPASDYGIRFWQKLDHCCIYLMIAGSYTPTALLVFDGYLRWGLFTIVWLIALVGCLLKVFNRLKSTLISVSIYILMGCLIVPLLQKMLITLSIGAIFWLLLGGVLYISGTYFYAKDKQMYRWMHSHELWHLFVIGGALAHYIYNYIYIFK